MIYIHWFIKLFTQQISSKTAKTDQHSPLECTLSTATWALFQPPGPQGSPMISASDEQLAGLPSSLDWRGPVPIVPRRFEVRRRCWRRHAPHDWQSKIARKTAGELIRKVQNWKVHPDIYTVTDIWILTSGPNGRFIVDLISFPFSWTCFLTSIPRCSMARIFTPTQVIISSCIPSGKHW